jgi:hypothetical protein
MGSVSADVVLASHARKWTKAQLVAAATVAVSDGNAPNGNGHLTSGGSGRGTDKTDTHNAALRSRRNGNADGSRWHHNRSPDCRNIRRSDTMTLVDNVTTSVASDKTGGCFLHNLSRSYHVRPAYDVIGLNNDIGNDCNGWRRGGVRRSRLKYLAVAVGGAASSTAKSPADALVVSAATDKTAAKAALTGSNGRMESLDRN